MKWMTVNRLETPQDEDTNELLMTTASEELNQDKVDPELTSRDRQTRTRLTAMMKSRLLWRFLLNLLLLIQTIN